MQVDTCIRRSTFGRGHQAGMTPNPLSEDYSTSSPPSPSMNNLWLRRAGTASLSGFGHLALRTVPAAQRMVPCCSEDGAQRMVPCCSEDGPVLLRGWSPAAQKMIPCCSEDDPLLLRGCMVLRGWSRAAQRMVPCHSVDGPQYGSLTHQTSI